MRIIHCSAGETVPAVPAGAVFLLGYFDGVHLGHRALLGRAAELAGDGGVIAVWTFECLPKGETLTDNEEKTALLRDCGADYVIFEDFASLKELDGRTFFEDVIVRRHHPSAVVCGYNFRFGKGAAQTAEDLRRFAAGCGTGCEIVPPREHDGVPVSSSVIRALLSAGRTEEASGLLGRPYSVTLPVMHGRRIGRTIGHRTINQIIPPGRCCPAHGVYSCAVTFTGRDGIVRTRGGVCNIGSRPTVNSDREDVTLETHIFDWDGDLYGLPVRTEFYGRLRGEKKFASVEELARQIARDGASAAEDLMRRGVYVMTEPENGREDGERENRTETKL